MKSLSILVTILYVCLTPCLLNGQDTRLLDLYNKETISFEDNQFVRDGLILKYKEVKPLLMKFPDSANEFSKYNKQNRLAQIIAIPGAALIGLMFVVPKSDRDTRYILGLTGVGLLFTTSFITNDRLLPKSVWLYNRDILLEKY